MYWEPSKKQFDKFRVEYKKEEESTYQELRSDKITKVVCILETLPAGMRGDDASDSYQFRVAAINKTGCGPFTDFVTTNSKLYICRYIATYVHFHDCVDPK